MSEVEWRGRTVPVKIDKVRIFLLGLADNEAAIVQVRRGPLVLSCVYEGVPFTVTVMGRGALRGWLTAEGHPGAAGAAAVPTSLPSGPAFIPGPFTRARVNQNIWFCLRSAR